MNKAKAAVVRKGAAAKPVLGRSRGPQSPKAMGDETVRWTVSSGKRAELKRGAGRSQTKTPAIELYYWPTPNGHKISIALEELKLPYTLRPVNIGKGEQFAPTFLAISPNNRIPAIVDPQGPGGPPIAIFESGAILQYLGRKTGKFYPRDERKRVAVDEWLFWQVGGLGPMAGQANHFRNYAGEDIAYAKKRYGDELHRLFGVMNTRLKLKPYLAGAYSIADMACVSWVRSASRHQPLAEFPHLSAWFDRVMARPAVVRGLAVGRELRKSAPTDDEKKVLFGQRAR